MGEQHTLSLWMSVSMACGKEQNQLCCCMHVVQFCFLLPFQPFQSANIGSYLFWSKGIRARQWVLG